MSTTIEDTTQEIWKETFRQLWDQGCAAYKAGERDPETMFAGEAATQLASFGYRPVEMFDFVDDSIRYDNGPTYDWSLAVAGVRRDYFLKVQNGNCCVPKIDSCSLPAKGAAVEGIEWLPRLIAKAHAKLEGSMPDELMYGCAGDRAFFRNYKVDPAQFLRTVWEAGSDDAPVIAYVKNGAG